MKRIVLLLLVVLWMESTASADYIPMIREVENGCPSLETYVVGITIDDEEPLQVIGNLEIDSGVHQLTISGLVTPDHDGSIGPVLGEYALLDTYFFEETLSVYGTYTHHYGSDYTETNDGSDPCNIVGQNAFIDSAGFGSFLRVDQEHVTETTIYELQDENLKSIEFMQIVIAAGTQVTLTGNYATMLMCETGFELPAFSITVGVPEPSSVVLIVIGSFWFFGGSIPKERLIFWIFLLSHREFE